MRTNDEIITVIKKTLKEQNMSLSELARRVGMAKSAVSRYLNLTREFPLNRAEDFAKVLHISTEYLLGFDKDEHEDISVSLYQDIIENLEDLNENNAPLVNDFIEEIIKEQNNKSTLIPETTRIQISLSYIRQTNVLNFANHQLQLQNKTQDTVIDLHTYKNDNTNETPVNGYVSAGTGEQIFDEPIFTVNVKGDVPPHDIALQVNGDSMEPMFSNKEIIFIEKSNDIKNGQIGVFIIDGEAYVKKVHVGEDRLTLVSLNKDYRDLHFYENEGVELVGKVIL